jgi:ribosomal protein S6--L-glutamate ligase
VKLVQGTQGVGVLLAETAAALEAILDTLWGLGQNILIQEFIPESRGQDIRALVVGNRVVASMKRIARVGDFRSNIHRGGEGRLVTLTPDVERVALEAARVTGLALAGVDMLESPTGPKVIEINSSPGFEGLEAATKVDIASEILDYAESLAAGRKKETRARA